LCLTCRKQFFILPPWSPLWARFFYPPPWPFFLFESVERPNVQKSSMMFPAILLRSTSWHRRLPALPSPFLMTEIVRGDLTPLRSCRLRPFVPIQTGTAGRIVNRTRLRSPQHARISFFQSLRRIFYTLRASSWPDFLRLPFLIPRFCAVSTPWMIFSPPPRSPFALKRSLRRRQTGVDFAPATNGFQSPFLNGPGRTFCVTSSSRCCFTLRTIRIISPVSLGVLPVFASFFSPLLLVYSYALLRPPKGPEIFGKT